MSRSKFSVSSTERSTKGGSSKWRVLGDAASMFYFEMLVNNMDSVDSTELLHCMEQLCVELFATRGIDLTGKSLGFLITLLNQYGIVTKQ